MCDTTAITSNTERTADASVERGLSTPEAGIGALVVVTAILHLYAGYVEGAPPVFLAGIGFLAGLGLYLRGVRQHALTLAAIPFTAVQIPLWYVVKAGNFTLVGYIDKATQVVLVIALLVLALRQRNSDPGQ